MWTFLWSLRACRDMSKHSLKPPLMAVINWQVDWQLKCQRLSLHSVFTYKLEDISPCLSVDRNTLDRVVFLDYFRHHIVTHPSSQGVKSNQIGWNKLTLLSETHHKDIVSKEFMKTVRPLELKTAVFWNTFKAEICNVFSKGTYMLCFVSERKRILVPPLSFLLSI